jgi:hypothetical protein
MPRTRKSVVPAPAPVGESEEMTAAIAPKTAAPAKPQAAAKAAPKASAPTAARPAEHISTADLREDALREPEHAPARVRTRKKNIAVEDEFYIPTEEIPDGLDYNWKRFSVNGQEDPYYLARMRSQGWEPVPPSRHPTWVPPGYNAPHIIKGGQILMDRPMELSNEAKAENEQLARRQVREAEQRLGKTPKDTMTRDFPGVEPKITKEIGRMIPIAIED